MKAERTIPGLDATGEILDPNFLSIDIEALLRKLPSRSFRSPHHYPVELVRAALVRGAGRVEVIIRRSRVEIKDNGNALDQESLEKLCDVFDPDRPSWHRQAALSFFEKDRGIGVLAAFAPSPKEVIIETAGDSAARRRTVFRRGQAPLKEKGDKRSGTHIIIFRSEGDIRKERETLEDYCRLAQAQILLDGRLISRHKRSKNEIVSADLPSWENVGGGAVWIPDEGDVCRVWFLDHGIRWNQSVYPPDRGMVYETAVECTGKKPADFSKRILKKAAELYRILAAEYDSLPYVLRDRIEELLFLHYRHARDMSILGEFAPFRVLDGKKRMSLSEIRSRASQGKLQALRIDDDPADYYTKSTTVLVLTQRQWEFLVDHAGVQLSSPMPAPTRDPWPVRLGRWVKKKAENISSFVRAGLLKPVDRGELEEEEIFLLDLISNEISNRHFRMPGKPSGKPVEVIMNNRGGKIPGKIYEEEDKKILALSRHNRLVRRAAAAVKEDAANIYMVLPMLTEGYDGWR